MEIKDWTYEEFPECLETEEGAVRLLTTGEEIGVRYVPDIPYLEIGGEKLLLQLLLPHTRNQPERLWPCMVFVQGSAWMKQDIYCELPSLSKIAARGYVVALVQYRHSDIAAFPSQAQDTRDAIRFLRVHASEYQINPGKMIVSGTSSGGHTALFAGIISEGSELDASHYPGVSAEAAGIIDYYGSVSLMYEDGFPTTVNHHQPDSPEGMVMGHIDLRGQEELCRKASVECQITPETKLAPVMILHGTKDRTVNTHQSIELYRRLKACRKAASLYLLEGADHGGPEFWTDPICDLIDQFMQSCFASLA